jgi:hypothetical protein
MYKKNHFSSIFLKFLANSRVTTTLIPLNVCPTEYCQTIKPTPIPLVNIIENRQEQNTFEHKSKGIITTHLIGDWIIRESSEPFQRKENQQSTPIEQLVNEEKKVNSNESIISSRYSSPNVSKWTVSYCLIRLFFDLVTKSRLFYMQHIDFFSSSLLRKNDKIFNHDHKQMREKLY